MSPTPKRQNEVRCPHCGTLNDASRTQCISCKSPMGLAVQPFEFPATGQAVRTVLRDDGEPWFVAADVCAVLAIRNNRDALTALDDDEKGVATTDTPGGEQQVSVVNEPGLYSLILRSRKPEAKAFKRWITHDVLPALRKGGTYSVESRELTRRDLARMVIEEADRADQAEQRAAELAPAAAAWDNLGQAMRRLLRPRGRPDPRPRPHYLDRAEPPVLHPARTALGRRRRPALPVARRRRPHRVPSDLLHPPAQRRARPVQPDPHHRQGAEGPSSSPRRRRAAQRDRRRGRLMAATTTDRRGLARTAEAAEYLGRSVGTLANWRSAGDRPALLRPRPRRPLPLGRPRRLDHREHPHRHPLTQMAPAAHTTRARGAIRAQQHRSNS